VPHHSPSSSPDLDLTEGLADQGIANGTVLLALVGKKEPPRVWDDLRPEAAGTGNNANKAGGRRLQLRSRRSQFPVSVIVVFEDARLVDYSMQCRNPTATIAELLDTVNRHGNETLKAAAAEQLDGKKKKPADEESGEPPLPLAAPCAIVALVNLTRGKLLNLLDAVETGLGNLDKVLAISSGDHVESLIADFDAARADPGFFEADANAAAWWKKHREKKAKKAKADGGGGASGRGTNRQ